jgi:biopolymer transport protein ExbD
MHRIGGATAPGSGLDAMGDVEINMTPLIDMIFILLIFFLVTASFVKESGVEVNRPEAASAEREEAVGMVVGVTGDGRIYMDGREVDLRRVRGLVEVFLAENEKGGVIIDTDSSCVAGRMIAVLDQCRLAGATNIAVSAKKPGE